MDTKQKSTGSASSIWRDWPPYAYFLFTVIWFGLFAVIGTDPHHDGLMLKPAMDIASGQTLFRDSFTMYGALTSYLQAASLYLFGPYLIVLRILTAIFYGLIVLLTYEIWRKFLSERTFLILFILLITTFPFYQIDNRFLPWSSVNALFFMLLGNLFFTKVVDIDAAIHLRLAGVASALAFWCRQPTGIVMLIAAGLFLGFELISKERKAKESLTRLYTFLSGFIGCSILFILYLYKLDALQDWYQQSILLAYSYGVKGSGIKLILSNLFPIKSIYIIFPITAMIVLFRQAYQILFSSLKPEKIKIKKMLMMTALISLGSWHQYHPIPDTIHCFWAAIPMLGCYVYLAEKLSRKLSAKAPPYLYPIVLSACFVVFIPIVVLAISDAKTNLVSTPRVRASSDSPLKGMRLTTEEIENYEDVERVIQELAPGTREHTWLNMTRDPLYCLYFPSLTNASPMYVNWGNMVYPDYNLKIMAMISTRPCVVLYNADMKIALPPDVQEIQRTPIKNGLEIVISHPIQNTTN